MTDLNAKVEELYKEGLGWIRASIPTADAEDVIQDIFVSVLESIDSFKGKSAFRTWAMRIARNERADYYRKSHSFPELVFSEVAGLKNAAKPIYNDFEAYNLLEFLPEHWRDVVWRDIVWKHFVEGFTYVEIAEQEGQTYNTIKCRSQRAIEYIRRNKLIER